MRIGIDSGGTFTDFVVLYEDGKLESFKLRSNPAEPASVILAGLAKIAAELRTSSPSDGRIVRNFIT
jgi:N-methylhydantoinase A